MKKYFENLAKALLGQPYSELDAPEQRVIDSIAEHTTVAENVNESFTESLTFGQKLADGVAAFGGSWKFIGYTIVFRKTKTIRRSAMIDNCFGHI